MMVMIMKEGTVIAVRIEMGRGYWKSGGAWGSGRQVVEDFFCL